MQITTSDLEKEAKRLKLTEKEFTRLLRNNDFLKEGKELELTKTGKELFDLLRCH